MNWTWPQQHAINWQFKNEVEKSLINSSQIHTWAFDAYQSNVLLNFNFTDQGFLQPVVLNLPDLLKQQLDQFQPANTSAQDKLEAESLLAATAKDGILSQNQYQALNEGLINQDSKESGQKEGIDQDQHPALEIWKHSLASG